MPRRLRTIVTEVVMYVGMFTIVGHLFQNLCERYMMHKDLKIMKSNIYSLQKTINNMEIVYGSLLDEVQICQGKDKAASSWTPLHPKCFKKCFKQLADAETKTKIATKDFMQSFKRSTSDFIQTWSSPAKDETTLTECKLNSLNYTDREAVETSEKVEFCDCINQCLSQIEKYGQLMWRNQNSPSNEMEQNCTETENNLTNKTRWKLVVYPVL